METAFGILKRDLLALAKNPMAFLVAGALLVLPGLRAWCRAIANWDSRYDTGTGRFEKTRHMQLTGATANVASD